MPIAFRLAEPAPVLTTRGMTPRMKANEVMRIGRSRKMHRFQRRFNQPFALELKVLGIFNDQNRVFGRQSDRRQQADFEINVVRQAAQVGGEQRAEHSSGTTRITDSGIDQLS